MASMKPKSNAARSVKPKEAPDGEGKALNQHVGEVLRQAREERGVSLDAVADELMIRRYYLDVLEAGSFKDLPERVYAIGFVKNYVNYLGLEPSVVEQFKRDAYGSRSMNNYQVELVMPEAVVHSVVPGRSAMISAIVVLMLLIGGIVFATQGKKPSLTSIPEPSPVQESADVAAVTTPAPAAANAPAATENTTTTPAPELSSASPTTTATAATAVTNTATVEAPTEFMAATTPEAPAATTTPATTATEAKPSADAAVATAATTTTDIAGKPATETTEAAAPAADEVNPAIANIKNHRVLEATQSSWVEVKDAKGAILFTSILRKGQMLPLPDDTKIMLTTGNAGGLRMIVDRKPQAPFGQPNEVKRNIVIDTQTLDQR